MTIEKLIEILEKHDREMQVYIPHVRLSQTGQFCEDVAGVQPISRKDTYLDNVFFCADEDTEKKGILLIGETK